MQYKDKRLFKTVCLEMGLLWDENLKEAEIDGIPASEYFKNNSLFPDEEVFCKNMQVSYQELNVKENSRFYCNDFSFAA